MSRTCTRVLAAVLMTGGIATALALPALVGNRPDEPRALIAPPSSLKRIVRVHTGAANERPNPKNTGTHVSIGRRSPAFASVGSHRGLAEHGNGASRPQAPAAAPIAAPKPAPAPAPTVTGPPAAPAPAPAQAAPAVAAPSRELASSNANGNGKSNGKAKGHDKQKAKADAAPPSADEEESEAAPAPAPVAAPASVPADDGD